MTKKLFSKGSIFWLTVSHGPTLVQNLFSLCTLDYKWHLCTTGTNLCTTGANLVVFCGETDAFFSNGTIDISDYALFTVVSTLYCVTSPLVHCAWCTFHHFDSELVQRYDRLHQPKALYCKVKSCQCNDSDGTPAGRPKAMVKGGN